MENTETNTEPTTPSAEDDKSSDGGDVLIVASKLKGYIKSKGGMNTSDAVMKQLSARVRQLCDQAMDRARAEGRKTVMDRDFA